MEIKTELFTKKPDGLPLATTSIIFPLMEGDIRIAGKMDIICCPTEKLRRNAGKISVPVLLFQAGRDTMVKPKGQELFCKKAKNVQCVRFEQSKHEIFNGTEDILESYYEKIFDFLDRNRK